MERLSAANVIATWLGTPGFVGAKFPLLVSGTRIVQGPHLSAAFSTPFLPCEKISGVFCTSRIGVSSVSCKISGDPSFTLVTASHQLENSSTWP